MYMLASNLRPIGAAFNVLHGEMFARISRAWLF
jgi:hypothetical protein